MQRLASKYLSFLGLLFLVAAPLAAETSEEPLSMTDLQRLLGIKSWRAVIPDDVDFQSIVEIEQFVDGKRFAIHNPGAKLNLDRSLLLVLEEEGKWKTLTIVGDSMMLPQKFTNLHKHLQDQREKPHLVYVVTGTAPEKEGEHDVIYRAIYYLSEEQENGYSSNPDKDKKLGETVIRVRMKPEEVN